MTDHWGFVLVFALIALSFPIIGFGAAWLVRPHRSSPVKLTTFECGLETIGETWIQFKVQYYLFALVFVIFDVETAFIYPWAVAYNSLPLFALFEMFIFLFILVVGLFYAWRKGALQWI